MGWQLVAGAELTTQGAASLWLKAWARDLCRILMPGGAHLLASWAAARK